MSLTNVAYYYPYTWENSGLETLEEQALVPLFADFPLELGFTTIEGETLEAFQSDPVYAELFPRASPRNGIRSHPTGWWRPSPLSSAR